MPNDFETVRNGLHYYGDTIPNDPEVLAESDAALDRIEAEVERLRERNRALESHVRKLTAEIAGPPHLPEDVQIEYDDGLRAEVERLRAVLKALVEADEAEDEWEGRDPAPPDSILGEARAALAEEKV